MSNYVVISDSCGDLPPHLAEGITIIPYIYTLDGKDYYSYLDYREQPVKEFYDTLRAGKMASTTQVTPQRYVEIWEPFLEEGKDIIYICLSSMLSKSFEMSQMAARELGEKHPDRKIFTIDSKAACMGIGLLAVKALEAQKAGKTVDEAATYVEELVTRTHLWVMADDLHHLRRGGRVSGASAFVGTMLSIKPILTIVDEGKLIPLSKVRGHGKVLDYFVDRMKESANPSDQLAFIAHSDAPDLAQQLKDALSEKLGIQSFVVTGIGPVIGAHTGPGTLALVFLGNERPKA